MNIEKQVVSLELSKRLKELDIKQESLFYWINNNNKNSNYFLSMKDGFNKTYHKEDMLSAFTASELFQMIPQRINLPTGEPFNSFTFYLKRSFVVITDGDMKNIKPTFITNFECDSCDIVGEEAFMRRQLFKNVWDDSLANCLAKLIIKLIENKLMKLQNDT